MYFLQARGKIMLSNNFLSGEELNILSTVHEWSCLVTCREIKL